jgi:hypothetical protein
MNISAKFGTNLFVASEKKMKMWNSHRVQCSIKSSHGGHLEFPMFNIGPYGNFAFSSFFLKPQNRFEPNLAEMFIGWSYSHNSIGLVVSNEDF